MFPATVSTAVDVAGAAAGVYAAMYDNMTEAREYVVVQGRQTGAYDNLTNFAAQARARAHDALTKDGRDYSSRMDAPSDAPYSASETFWAGQSQAPYGRPPQGTAFASNVTQASYMASGPGPARPYTNGSVPARPSGASPEVLAYDGRVGETLAPAAVESEAWEPSVAA